MFINLFPILLDSLISMETPSEHIFFLFFQISIFHIDGQHNYTVLKSATSSSYYKSQNTTRNPSHVAQLNIHDGSFQCEG